MKKMEANLLELKKEGQTPTKYQQTKQTEAKKKEEELKLDFSP